MIPSFSNSPQLLALPSETWWLILDKLNTATLPLAKQTCQTFYKLIWLELPNQKSLQSRLIEHEQSQIISLFAQFKFSEVDRIFQLYPYIKEYFLSDPALQLKLTFPIQWCAIKDYDASIIRSIILPQDKIHLNNAIYTAIEITQLADDYHTFNLAFKPAIFLLILKSLSVPEDTKKQLLTNLANIADYTFSENERQQNIQLILSAQTNCIERPQLQSIFQNDIYPIINYHPSPSPKHTSSIYISPFLLLSFTVIVLFYFFY